MENKELKLVKIEGTDYEFIKLETGTKVTLKIFKDKEFKNTLKIGDVGLASYGEVWLNEWKHLENKDKEKKEKPITSPFDKKNEQIIAQSTLKEAVKICIARGNSSVENIKEIHKQLYNYIINEEYK